MNTKSLSLVRGRRIRLTRLDMCGRPVLGDSSQAVSSGFISVAYSANTSESDEINVTNANGDSCIWEPSRTSLTGYGLEIQFCDVDPGIFSLLTGQDLVLDSAGDVVGIDVDTNIEVETGFALELWAGTAAGNACATEGAQGNFGYILIPFAQGGIIGDFTVENGAINLTITGASTRNGNAWGVGPYPDVQLNGGTPGPLVQPVKPSTPLRIMATEVAPPAPFVGLRPLLDESLPELTGVVATVDADDESGMTAAFDISPSPSTGPVWYDFGDGQWDYVEAPGESSHTYETSGTYTARASQNGVWVETSVTVPFA